MNQFPTLSKVALPDEGQVSFERYDQLYTLRRDVRRWHLYLGGTPLGTLHEPASGRQYHWTQADGTPMPGESDDWRTIVRKML